MSEQELTAKESELLAYADKLDQLDSEIQNLKLSIAKDELKKLELIGIRRQANHIYNRLKIEHESLKRQYFKEIRENP